MGEEAPRELRSRVQRRRERRKKKGKMYVKGDSSALGAHVCSRVMCMGLKNDRMYIITFKNKLNVVIYRALNEKTILYQLKETNKFSTIVFYVGMQVILLSSRAHRVFC